MEAKTKWLERLSARALVDGDDELQIFDKAAVSIRKVGVISNSFGLKIFFPLYKYMK